MKYIPVPAFPDRMPLDLSFCFGPHEKAGAHGFLKADGERFVFEDGTEARFWGVNFNGSANFPSHSYADGVARRLRQAGCNIVRMHQLDADCHAPNLFQFQKGPPLRTTRRLDPDSMERLDYLIYALKEQGIYIYMDFLVYRKFLTGDGVVCAKDLSVGGKPYSVFDPTLIGLQKELITELLTHCNPYTGLRWCDDPVFAMAEIVNENDIFKRTDKRIPYYEDEMKSMFAAWLEKQGKTFDWEKYDFLLEDPDLWQFKTEITMDYYRQLRGHIRAVGGKFPVTGTNYTGNNPGNVLTQREMDFCDNHGYVFEFGLYTEDHSVSTVQQINGQQCVLPVRSYMRLNNRPFFWGEWHMPWPNPYRAEGPIYYAAVCALQGWSGMAIHTYSYSSDLDRHSILGKEVAAPSIGGVHFREGLFNAWNDPAVFSLFYHCALLVRRKDLAQANEKYGVKLDAPYTLPPEANATGLEVHRLQTVPDGEEPTGCTGVVKASERFPSENPDIIMADNRQMWRVLSKKIGGIDTARSKIYYGRLMNVKKLAAAGLPTVDGLSVDTTLDFGVVALSSLSDAPIASSDHLLLTTVGRAKNTDMQFDGDELVDFGHEPIVAEVIHAVISIDTERDDLAVYGIGPEGHTTGRIAAKYADGKLTFTVGARNPAIHYLITSL